MNRPLHALLVICTAAALAAGDATPVPAGTVFHAYGMVYLAGTISFADASGDLWPNHFYAGKGDGVKGTVTFDAARPAGSFTLVCPKLVQPGDGFQYRILGERMSREKPPEARFTLKSFGPWLAKPPEGLGDPAKTGPYEWCTAEGTIAVDATEVPVSGHARFGFTSKGGGGGLAANSLMGMSVNVRCIFTVPGRQLGLVKLADKSVRITVESRAFTEPTLLDGMKKKSLSELGIK